MIYLFAPITEKYDANIAKQNLFATSAYIFAFFAKNIEHTPLGLLST